MWKRRNLLALLCLILAPACFAADEPPAELAAMDAYILKSMLDWKVPGLAIAVVKDDQVVWARGFGLRRLGAPQAVDAGTLFGIGSNTKAFTAAALGTLVQEGKLGWDSRVTDLLPGFQMYDPYVTREVTLRDLLSHRSGTCGEDGVWFSTDFDSQQIIQRLRYQKPAYGFRSQFCYSNSLYMTAGEVIPQLTGTSWREYVRQHFFVPLHMDTAVTSITAFTQGTDVASPHAEVDGKLQPIAWDNTDNIDPAGAIDASVSEMAQWMRMLLADGRYEGKQVLSADTIHEMETPQMLIGGKDGEAKFLAKLNPDSHFYAYGLGFFLQDYAGEKVIWHSGHIDGMSAGLGMVPSRHLGVVVLSNMDQSWLPMALVWRVVDAYDGRPQKDWSAAVLKAVAPDYKAGRDEDAALAKTYQPGTAPLPLASYVGTYSDDLYGSISITLEHSKLMLHVSKRFDGELKHWNHDSFQVQWNYAYLGKSYASFGLDVKGAPATVTIPGLATYTRVTETSAGQ
ncbi:MAG TPA: serine hydrolase [Gammaproteobacteria bacterium]|jgi:CubicO group peptidase (beta-lactamase class C family)